MAQLAGSPCARCQKTIPSKLDGEFCQVCGNPVHKACKALPTDQPEGCQSCGSRVSNPVAAEVRAERKDEFHRSREEAQLALRGNYPVSRVCPACQSTEYTPRRPSRWYAFAKDRTCTFCGTIYTPPVPAWAGVACILGGLASMALGIVAIIRGSSMWDARIGLIGIVAVIYGIRVLMRQGKV